MFSRHRSAIGDAAVRKSHIQFRRVTTKGQFNPIHRFFFPSVLNTPEENHLAKLQQRGPQDEKAFRRMVTNPGPLTIHFSADYLDWYFKAYRDKKKYHTERMKIEDQKTEVETYQLTRADAPAPQILRPLTSRMRQAGEAMRRSAQQVIDDSSIQHGFLDCFERQPQFPQIHINKCTDLHIAELVKRFLVEPALTAESVWEKALMYRAMLLEKRNSYPSTFAYVIEHADAVVLAEENPNTPHADDGSPSSLTHPTKAAYEYFARLVRRFHVDNAVDAHVVLNCHALPEAEHLLACQPPPKPDPPGTSVPSRPTKFPPIDSLWTVKDNLHLARCAVFAELNGVVSTDPFAKYPEARACLTRPTVEMTSQMRGAVGAAHLIAAKRGRLLPDLTQNQQSALDARGREVGRMQATHARSDSSFARELPRLADEHPELYQADSAAYNPWAVRAEIRDFYSRQMLAGLDKYEKAQSFIFREPLDNLEETRRVGDITSKMPETRPTIPHFLRVLQDDIHVSFAMTMGPPHLVDQMRSAMNAAAMQMLKMSLEYHIPLNRRIHHEKLVIALDVFDRKVSAILIQLKETGPSWMAKQVESLGKVLPFASRPLDNLGFPSMGRMDDYQRWMAKPVIASSTASTR